MGQLPNPSATAVNAQVDRLTAMSVLGWWDPCCVRMRCFSCATKGVYHICCPPSPLLMHPGAIQLSLGHFPIFLLPFPTWRSACCSGVANYSLQNKDIGMREMKECSTSYTLSSSHLLSSEKGLGFLS